MKNIVLLLILSNFFQAQTNIIEYKYINDEARNIDVFTEFLIQKNESTLYFAVATDFGFISFDDYKKLPFEPKKLNYFLLNDGTNIMYQLGTRMPPTKILAKDEIPEFKWKISTETRQILNYNCTKAEGTFRGRKYIAWFTTQLPMQVGPWKFRGLPGTILEIADEDKMQNYYATKIHLNTDYTIFPEFQEYIDLKKKNIISYRDYINGENKYIKQIVEASFADAPFGTTMASDKIRVNERESLLEWETEPAKY